MTAGKVVTDLGFMRESGRTGDHIIVQNSLFGMRLSNKTLRTERHQNMHVLRRTQVTSCSPN